MNMMNSKERYDRAEVMAIESPAFTKTWHPIRHADVIISLSEVIKEKGIGIVYETYSVKNGGNNLFGTWVLDVERGGKHVQIGFRNSIQKTFAVGICAGTYIMVCSNMQFHGDYIEFRKHTSGLDFDEMKVLGMRAFDEVMVQGNKAIDWHESLKNYSLDGDRFKCAVFDAIHGGVIAPNKFNGFMEAYEMEKGLSNDSTIYEFHGAITRMNNKLNLFTTDRRTRELAQICDNYMVQ